MIWNLKISIFTTTKLDIAPKILSTNYMYILLKLKPGSLLLAIDLHQPGIHFYHVLKKAPSINWFNSLLDKDPNLLQY